MRSLTAEAVYSMDIRYSVKSCGISRHPRIKISRELILWADIVFIMESRYEEIIRNEFPEETISKRIISLDIHDKYYFMEPELINLIKSGVAPFLINQ